MSLKEDMEIDTVTMSKIVNHRKTRFTGETLTCNINEITTLSSEKLQWLYKWLETVGKYKLQDLSQTSVMQALKCLLNEAYLQRVINFSRGLMPAKLESARVESVLHDLRGASLQQVIALASLCDIALLSKHDLQAIAIFAHDHAKVMRHAVIGLDEKKRSLDTQHRLHGVKNLIGRFSSLSLANSVGKVIVDFNNTWNGDFAVTCSEFSTILKQLYNLLNNAARHTTTQVVFFRIFPKPQETPSSVRFVVANTLSQTDRRRLDPTVLKKLWRGYTSTSSGLGLVSCAALVGEAFGLENPDQAVDLGYVGSRVTNNGYIAWLHWPIVLPNS